MEFLKVFLFSAICISASISSIFAQKTFRRACDCEYTVDGKCAYTLLLPKGQDTCSQDGSTSNGGNSPNDQMTSDVMDRITRLQTNVSQLWSVSGDQARMLNQLQSMFIAQQENMFAMSQNMSLMLSTMAENMTSEMLNAMNMFNIFNANASSTPDMNMLMNIMQMLNMSTMPQGNGNVNNGNFNNGNVNNGNGNVNNGNGNVNNGNVNNGMSDPEGVIRAVMGQAMQSLEQQSQQLQQVMMSVNEKVMNQSMVINKLNKDVMNLSASVDKRMESLRQQLKADYFLCHKRGLLVSGTVVRIPDEQISASSQFNANHHPARSRINTMADAADYGAWCPAEPNLDEWIQIDLGTPRTIFAIVTRGRPDYEQWVTQYKLQYTEELTADPSQTMWITYKGLLDDDMLFEGNMDQNTQKINDLWQPIRVRYVRIVPTAAYQDSNKCMRVDLLGCVDSE